VEDIASGQSRCILQIKGCLGLDTDLTVGIPHHAVLDGFIKNPVRKSIDVESARYLAQGHL
jgi:hypothetical protein